MWPTFTNADSKVLSIGDPITVGDVANLHGLSVFDTVYTAASPLEQSNDPHR